jgi:hypothetical protein
MNGWVRFNTLFATQRERLVSIDRRAVVLSHHFEIVDEKAERED